MQLQFSPTFSWQAFSLHGLPSGMGLHEGKNISLGKAVEVWNACIAARKDALLVATVSVQIRMILDTARDSRKAAIQRTPMPAFSI